jgi:C-terminal processing protease CtpA/Prc
VNRIGIAAPILALGLLVSGVNGAEHGWFGMRVKVDGTGFFLNPTIQEVVPDSPAAQEYLAAGDQIIEIEGRVVAGKKAKELEPLMEKAVGEALHLRIKRADGKLFSAVLIAAPQPK